MTEILDLLLAFATIALLLAKALIVGCGLLIVAIFVDGYLSQAWHAREMRLHHEAQLRAQHRATSATPSPGPSIKDRHHPLYCHGARRGPDITNREYYR